MYTNVLSVCMSVYALHAVPVEARRGHRTPGSVVPDGVRPQVGAGNRNFSPEKATSAF